MSDDEIRSRLEKRLERERQARLQSEAIAETTTAELYQRQRELVLLHHVAKASNEATDEETIYGIALRLVCKHMDWPIGHIYNVDENGGLHSTALWHGDQDAPMTNLRIATDNVKLATGEGLPGRVLAERTPVWIPDVTQDSNFPRARDNKLEVRTGIAFPILVGSEIVAVAEFFSPRVLPPDRRILDLLRDVGMQLGRVTERTRATQRMLHDALHDALTGLPNRTLFADRLERAWARAKRNSARRFGVLYVDLDRFKVVNDSLGHNRGDELLKALSVRFQSTIRRSDTVARLGGDKFGFLIEDITDAKTALVVAEHVHQQLTQAFELGGQDVFVSASIGIAFNEAQHEQPQDLLRAAEMAMYRAKERGKSRNEIFDRVMHDEAMARLQLENLLRQAVPRKELRLHYQPIVQLPSREIREVEALVRWHHPDLGLVSPARFIPVAEETGLIVQVGSWVLEEACRQLKAWTEEVGRPLDLGMSVNVSTRQFSQPSFIDEVRRVLRDYAIPPEFLKLEITESVLMANPEVVGALLRELRGIGIKIVLDDFGTGYSSLSYLHQLPVDALKIDGSFVKVMESDPRSAELIKTIVLLAQNFGMGVVAECVETESQAEKLYALGCRQGQGYLFSKPLEAAALGKLLANR